MEFENRAPVQPGQELEVEIINIGEKGDGVAKVKGFILFVPGTKKDQKVRIRVTKVFKKVGFAEVINEIQDNSQEDQQIEDTEDFGEETNGG